MNIADPPSREQPADLLLRGARDFTSGVILSTQCEIENQNQSMTPTRHILLNGMFVAASMAAALSAQAKI
jgi:hypothetical protein